jgi:NADPH:quinone reductase-like Zn-dependent oxidoreductase
VVVFVVLWCIALTHTTGVHRTDVLSDLMEKVSKEEIVPKVTKSFILEKIREAHRTLDTNNVGTIIIKH